MKEGCLFVVLKSSKPQCLLPSSSLLFEILCIIQKAWMSRDALSYFHNVLTYKEGEVFEY
jgi:hypothetical protein